MRLPVHHSIALPLENSALLMVDFQEEQRLDPDYLAHQLDAVLANAARLLQAARAQAATVAHSAYIRDFTVEPPRPFETVTPDGNPTFSDVSGGMTGICPEVAPLADEPVFIKNDASAFAKTPLADWLHQRGIEWLLLCGVWTEACIAATLRDAVAAGFRVLLVKDACGSGTQHMHETAVLNLANRLFGGGVCDTARAVALLSGQPAPVWRMGDPVPFRLTAENTAALYDSL